MIDSLMCFKRGYISYPKANKVKGALGRIGKSVYVKYADEHIIREEVHIHDEDASRI